MSEKTYGDYPIGTQFKCQGNTCKCGLIGIITTTCVIRKNGNKIWNLSDYIDRNLTIITPYVTETPLYKAIYGETSEGEE